MSRATKHTVNETIEQLFEDEDEIPDHASDSEIEGDSDEEYNDILHFQGPVLFQAAVAAGTDTSLQNVSSTSTIATRQSKKAAKRKPADKIVHRPKRTRRSATIAADNLDEELSLLPVVENRSSDGDVDLEEDDQPDWKTTVASYFLTLPNFDEPCAPKVSHNFTNFSLPGEYFQRFFDDNTLLFITNETNKYAQQKQIKNWSATTIDEIKAFFGILITMGVIRLKQVDLYWSTDPYFETGILKNVMTCKRFKKLLEAFNINDNETAVPYGQDGYDKLHKV